MEQPSLVALEFVVERLDLALELFVDLLGLELVDRYPHPEFDAEMALLHAGPVAISLLCPTDKGDRDPFPAPEPRISQMTFTLDDALKFVDVRDRLIEAGAAIVHAGPGVFFLDRQMTEAVLGQSPSVVVMVAPDEDSPSS